MAENKTIREWLNTFEDPEIKRRALANFGPKNGSCYENFYRALMAAFPWPAVEEGMAFWKSIFDSPNPATAKFDDYKHLITGKETL